MSEFDTRVGTLATGPSPGQVRNSSAARNADPKASERPRGSTGVDSKRSAKDVSRTSAGAGTQQIVSHDSGLSATLERVAQVLEDFVPGDGDKEVATSLKISQDDDTGRFVYKSVDDRTGEVVRQFPPEEILNFISRFRDAAGLLVDGEV